MNETTGSPTLTRRDGKVHTFTPWLPGGTVRVPAGSQDQPQDADYDALERETLLLRAFHLNLVIDTADTPDSGGARVRFFRAGQVFETDGQMVYLQDSDRQPDPKTFRTEHDLLLEEVQVQTPTGSGTGYLNFPLTRHGLTRKLVTTWSDARFGTLETQIEQAQLGRGLKPKEG